MARSEARIAVSIWTDADFLALSPTAQRMFMFLLSQPDLAHDGVLALRERRWTKTAKELTRANVEDDLAELRAARFVVVDEDTEEVLIRSFIRRDKVYRQPNVLRAACDHLAVVSSRTILDAIAGELRRVLAADDIAEVSAAIVRDMIETIRKGSPNPSGNPSPKGSPNPSSDPPQSDDDANTHSDGDDVSAGVKGSGNPSGNPSPNPSGNPSAGTPGERGTVTAVRRASPFPVPRSSDPGPRPQSSTGGPRGWSDGDRRRVLDEGAPPPTRCSQHRDTHNPPNCGACADVRKAREQWDRDQAAGNARAQSERARQHAEAVRAAIDACRTCDEHGQVDGRMCLHDPDMTDRARRGAAAAAAAIRRSGGDR
ncbi:hypothetical protein [Micromonospora sp. WMMD998]|uniref:hypothetical protein n=1 Tax=Micromonospora sp. WMMD998 TaxID=3016092 RepID=UPI00249CDF01|nr:hypothetical protein [Micromonospora sp. WMMD998]WFE41938.1 hypothetical protein O7619_27220 [Micromonospora sp. WMMD998]